MERGRTARSDVSQRMFLARPCFVCHFSCFYFASFRLLRVIRVIAVASRKAGIARLVFVASRGHMFEALGVTAFLLPGQRAEECVSVTAQSLTARSVAAGDPSGTRE